MAIPTVIARGDASANRYNRFNYNGSLAVNNLDMTFRDPTTGYIHPMSDVNTTNYSSLTSKYLLQRYGAKYFAGMSGEEKLSTSAADLNFAVSTALVCDMVCASATFNIGDMVAVATNGGVTALLVDTVEATKDPDLAVGIVVQEYTSATTVVRCVMFSNLINPDMLGGPRMGKLTETAAFGAFTITGAGPYTGTYTFTQKLPAGALVLGYRANVSAAFAGASITAVTVKAGYSGQTGAFSADATQSAFAAGNISSLSTAAGPMPSSETAPQIILTITGGNVLNAGSITMSLIYVAPEGP